MATQSICNISGCGKRLLARGWCAMHYWRWKKYGDPTTVTVVQKQAAPYFHSHVLPYVGDECFIWPFSRDRNGYGRLWMNGRHRVVSRLVCEAEHGPPPNTNDDAAHSCGNGHLGCVSRRHLSWKSRAENVADSRRHGTLPSGERSGRSKLTWQEVRAIRAIGNTMKQAEIGAMFGVQYRTVGRILAGEIWKPDA